MKRQLPSQTLEEQFLSPETKTSAPLRNDPTRRSSGLDLQPNEIELLGGQSTDDLPLGAVICLGGPDGKLVKPEPTANKSTGQHPQPKENLIREPHRR